MAVKNLKQNFKKILSDVTSKNFRNCKKTVKQL